MTEKNELYAAVDLGSNSFHMIVAEIIDNQLHVIDRHKDMVRLANGLDKKGFLSAEKMDQAIESIKKIAQRIAHIPKSHLRVVGTNTLRKAKNASYFMDRASVALGKPIDIISGREEARILYLGVAHSLPNHQGQRLVIDIGGGSTELIIGQEFKPLLRESLHMGCVSYTQKFFHDGKISEKNWNAAVLKARRELMPIVSLYSEKGWDVVIGASGSMRATEKVIRACGFSVYGMNRNSLDQLIKHCLAIQSIDRLNLLNGLSTRRRPVFIGGLAIIKALFDSLLLEEITCSTGALREGIVYDLSGRLHHKDVRMRTIEKLSKQFMIDKIQSQRVKSSIDALVQVSNLKLTEMQNNLLLWSAQLHELGLNIAHSHFEKHAAYIITNADMPGFSNHEQLKLAVLVALQRRKIKKEWLQKLTPKQQQKVMPLIIILRLAVLFNRQRVNKDPMLEKLNICNNTIELKFNDQWLNDHPLTNADLRSEVKYLQAISLKYDIG